MDCSKNSRAAPAESSQFKGAEKDHAFVAVRPDRVLPRQAKLGNVRDAGGAVV
jgi:hypothetical protein